jgi:hypothetical protein
MKSISFFLLSSALMLCLAGCSEGTRMTGTHSKKEKQSSSDEEADIKSALAQLPAADRQAAEAQKFCAINNKNRLGSMGEPVKVMIDGQPVFLCCSHCEKAALKDKEKTLAKVKELKEKNKSQAQK